MRHQKIKNNLIEIWLKKWIFECAQSTELLCIKAFWWLAHFMRESKKLWKMMPKGSQNRCQNRHFGDQGSDFWDFGTCFFEGVFLIIFKARKNRPKIEKRRPKIEKRRPRMSKGQSLRRFGVGPAECAGPPGGRKKGGGITSWNLKSEISDSEFWSHTPDPGRARGGESLTRIPPGQDF